MIVTEHYGSTWEDTETKTRLLFVHSRPAIVRVGGRWYVTDAPIPTLKTAREISRALDKENVEARGPSGVMLSHRFSQRHMSARRIREIALDMMRQDPTIGWRLVDEVSSETPWRLYASGSLGHGVEYWENIDALTGERPYDDPRSRGNLYRYDVPRAGQSVFEYYDWASWEGMAEQWQEGPDRDRFWEAVRDPNATPETKAWSLYEIVVYHGVDELDSYPLHMTQGELDWRWWE